MLTNQYTLVQLKDLTAGEVDDIPLDQMQTLLEAVAQAKEEAKKAGDKLTASMHRRYERSATEARRRLGKNNGSVTLYDGDYQIKADLPKKVTWDTPQLQAAWHEIAQMGEDPAEIIEVKLNVPENRFKALTTRIQRVLMMARTEGCANPTFAIERRSDTDD